MRLTQNDSELLKVNCPFQEGSSLEQEQVCFHTHTSPLVGLGRDVWKGLWAEILWGMSDSAYRDQLYKDSHAFDLQHLLHL